MVSFVFNVLVAALIVYVGDQLGVGTQLSTAIIVVLGIRIFSNTAALRRRLFRRDGDEITVVRIAQNPWQPRLPPPQLRVTPKPTRALTTPCDVVVTNYQPTIRAPRSDRCGGQD